jgi:tetratricopeptide (TPR) repeat protein
LGIHQAVLRNPENAELRYAFGAQLAQNGQYDQAAQEITTALQLQPALHTARFQLGLLYLTQAKPAEAVAAWAPLEALDDRASLKHFKRGLEALIRDDFPVCIEFLERGIALNDTNPALNGDMSLIIGKAREALQNAAAPASQEPREESTDTVRTDFSLYSADSK